MGVSVLKRPRQATLSYCLAGTHNWLSIATSGRSDRSLFADASLFEENTDAQLFNSGIEVADGSA